MKWLTSGLLIASCGVLGGCFGGGEPRPEPQNDVQPMLDRYYRCVRDSAASQMIAQAKMTRDGNAIAEAAFMACGTEEGTIRTYMSIVGINGAAANTVIIKHRTALKQEIVAANPSPITR